MSWWDVTVQIVGAVSGVSVVVGIWAAVAQLSGQKKQLHREFENLYVQRYWTIMDQFSADYRVRGKREVLSDGDLMACLSYLQLCEDEADLYEVGRITQDTWSIWKSGIDYMLEQDHFRTLLEGSSPAYFATLRRYILEGRLAPKYLGTKARLRGL